MTQHHDGDSVGRINAESIRTMYDLERRQQLDEWAALWAEHCVVSFPFATDPASMRVEGKDTLVAWTAEKFRDRDKVEIEVEVAPFADGRRVMSQLHARIHFATGDVLALPILCLFTFDEAGLILTMEEYVNEALISGQFGVGRLPGPESAVAQ